MAKLFGTELQGEVLDRLPAALRRLRATWREYPIARAWADARVARIAGGAAEVMKEIIGRRLFADAAR